MKLNRARHGAVGLLTVMTFLMGCQSVSSVRTPEGPGPPKLLGNDIERILQEEQFENGIWAVLITDLNTGIALVRHNEKISFIPASNTKLYTTSAALDQLGPEFTYETTLFIDGPIVDGVLEGNVIVRGSGDPVIGGRFNDGDLTETFRNWADSLSSRGIHTITGDIIGDDDIFDDTPLGYGWSWDDEPYWYSAEISGLSFNDNCIDITIAAQDPGVRGIVSWEPANTSFADIVNNSISVDPDSSLKEGYSRERGTNTFRLFSEVPEGRVDRESLSVRNPTLFFVHVLWETLHASGIVVEGRPLDIDDVYVAREDSGNELIRVATHESKPLKDIIMVLNKRSQNLYAEQILKTLGATRPVDDPDLEPGSAEMGIARAMDTYVAAGIDTSRIQLVDGSGLSRMNLVTAEMTSSLLGYMYRHHDDSTRAAFYRSLPISGVDGTLKSRMKSGPAFGRVHAKTGTVSNVSTISGYVQSEVGTPLSFVLMANHFTVKTSAVRDAQDRIIELLATYTR